MNLRDLWRDWYLTLLVEGLLFIAAFLLEITR